MTDFSDAGRMDTLGDRGRHRSHPVAWQVVMVVFIVIAVAMPLLCAAYVGGYERAAYDSRYDGCNGQDGYQALLRGSGPAQEGNGEGDAQNAQSHGNLVSGKPLNKSLAITCQANAIMRAAMHVQVITYIGSLVPLGIGLLAALIGLWTFIDDLKGRASHGRKPVSGNSRSATDVVAEPDVEAVAGHSRMSPSGAMFIAAHVFCLFVIERRRIRRAGGHNR